MIVKGKFYLKSGLIINEHFELDKKELEDLTEVEIKERATEAIKSINEDMLQPCFKSELNGYLEFGNTLFRMSDISAVKFIFEE